MASRLLTDSLAWGRHALAGIQPLPFLALLLVLAAVVLHVAILPDREAAIDAAERRLASAERESRRSAINRENPDESPAAARLKLLGRFQTEERLNATLGRLLDLAREGGLQVPSGDYRLVAAKDGLLERYVLNLPVRGQYLAVRRYAAAVRGEFADLAVEDIALRRNNIADGEVEAQIRLVVFGRRGDA